MNHTYKLMIALVLGAASAAGNSYYIRSQVAKETFVVVTRPLKAGEKFTSANIGPIALAGDVRKLSQSAVPWREKEVLTQSKSPKAMSTGELLLYRDINPDNNELPLATNEFPIWVSTNAIPMVAKFVKPGRTVFFGVQLRDRNGSGNDSASESVRMIGPFRIVAKGDETDPWLEAEGSTSRASHPYLTVAGSVDAQGNWDPNSQTLHDAAYGVRGRVVSITVDQRSISAAGATKG